MSNDSHLAVSDRCLGLSEMRRNWHSGRPSRQRVGQFTRCQRQSENCTLQTEDRRPQTGD